MRKNERAVLCNECLLKMQGVEAANMRKYRQKISKEIKWLRSKVAVPPEAGKK